jgi:hypothetical protein
MALAEKTIMPADAEDTAGAQANEAIPKIDNLATTMLEIDRLISDVVPEKNVAEASTDKGKRIEDTSPEDKISIFGTWVANNFPKRIYQN